MKKMLLCVAFALVFGCLSVPQLALADQPPTDTGGKPMHLPTSTIPPK